MFPAPKFIWKLWEQHKISGAVAVKDLVASRGRGAMGMVKQIELFEQAELRSQLEAESERRLKKIRLTRKRPRRHAVVREWDQQGSDGDPEEIDRCKALLLLGDSRAGKTVMAADHQPLERTLLVNCQGLPGGALPDISKVHRDGKDTVIWEEITVQQVLMNKRVFQSTAYITELGDSACHAFSYPVLPAKLRHILCTNEFPRTQAEDPKLSKADEDYLQKNFYVPALPAGVKWWLESDEEDEEMTNEQARLAEASPLPSHPNFYLGGG